MSTIGNRKADHLALCATGDVGFRAKTTLLEEVRLVHEALPELSLDEVDLSTQVLGKKLRAPLLIAAMTGGTEEARRINRELASIAETRGYGFGLGSQRAMHVRGDSSPTYAVREVAPHALLLGNLGGVQAATMSTAEVRALVDGVGADALCIHLNPAMEVVQPGGDRDFRGILDTLGRLKAELGVPVIAKETGCGISSRTGARLRSVGVRHVDVSGAGGTSWVGVETRRAADVGNASATKLGEAFWDWGIPTAASLGALAPLGFETLIATGGIACGFDVAKALALGADAAGIARPTLQALHEGGAKAVHQFFDGIESELRASMLLTGCRTIADLRRVPRLIGTALQRWIEQA